MRRLLLLLLIMVIALGMALTQHFALLNYWYWEFWWLDVAMHFSGGVVIGLSAYVFGGRRAVILYAVLLVGVVWEVYEYAIGISSTEPKFIFDTGLDLAMDIAGALLVYGTMWWWNPLSASPLSAAHDASPGQTSSLP